MGSPRTTAPPLHRAGGAATFTDSPTHRLTVIEVHDAHPARTLDADAVRRAVEAVCEGEGVRVASLGVVLGDHALVHDLNREWLGHDYETDVVSFELDEEAAGRGEIDGEVYVDLDTAAERAGEFDVTPEHEALRYVVHGVLHLVGYDDATDAEREAMRALEDRYLAAAPKPSTRAGCRRALRTTVGFALAVVALFWVFLAPVWWIGDLGLCASSVVPLVQTDPLPFESDAWRRGGEEVRGRMVTDLARRYELEGVPAADLTRLLGRHTCYVHYEDEPCYLVELAGERRAFGMVVAHSGPETGSTLAARLSGTGGPGLLGGCAI